MADFPGLSPMVPLHQWFSNSRVAKKHLLTKIQMPGVQSEFNLVDWIEAQAPAFETTATGDSDAIGLGPCFERLFYTSLSLCSSQTWQFCAFQ